MRNPLRIAVVSSDTAWRETLRSLRRGGIECDGYSPKPVTSQLATVELAHRALPAFRADVVIFDGRDGTLGGLLGLRVLRSWHPQPHYVLVSASQSPPFLRERGPHKLEAALTGAAYVIGPEADVKGLGSAITNVMASASGAVAGAQYHWLLSTHVVDFGPDERLTSLREPRRRIAELMCLGLTDREIAEAFGNAQSPVNRYIREVLEVIGYPERTNAR